MIAANPVPAIRRVRDTVSEKEGFHEQSVKRVGAKQHRVIQNRTS